LQKQELNTRKNKFERVKSRIRILLQNEKMKEVNYTKQFHEELKLRKMQSEDYTHRRAEFIKSQKLKDIANKKLKINFFRLLKKRNVENYFAKFREEENQNIENKEKRIKELEKIENSYIDKYNNARLFEEEALISLKNAFSSNMSKLCIQRSPKVE